MAYRSGVERTQQIRHGKHSRRFSKEFSERSGSIQEHQRRKAMGQQPTWEGGHANTTEFERQQQQAEAMANLATATAADRQAVSELSISNAKLTHELRTATATIATLQQCLASCGCAPTQTTGKKGQKQHQKNTRRKFTPLDPDGYWWSHGYHVSRGHNEASFDNTLSGHQSAATRADPMGGSTNNKPEWYTRKDLDNIDKQYSN